jgi:hypothetical protein
MAVSAARAGVSQSLFAGVDGPGGALFGALAALCVRAVRPPISDAPSAAVCGAQATRQSQFHCDACALCGGYGTPPPHSSDGTGPRQAQAPRPAPSRQAQGRAGRAQGRAPGAKAVAEALRELAADAFVLETRAKSHAQRVAELLSAEDLAAATAKCSQCRCPFYLSSGNLRPCRSSSNLLTHFPTFRGQTQQWPDCSCTGRAVISYPHPRTRSQHAQHCISRPIRPLGHHPRQLLCGPTARYVLIRRGQQRPGCRPSSRNPWWVWRGESLQGCRPPLLPAGAPTGAWHCDRRSWWVAIGPCWEAQGHMCSTESSVARLPTGLRPATCPAHSGA